MQIELLLEETSCEEALKILIPKIIGLEHQIRMHSFNGKKDLFEKIGPRLRAMKRYMPPDSYVFVLVDRDSDDCRNLKSELEEIAAKSGFKTRTASKGRKPYQLVNRIVVEELEAWFFGDVPALTRAFPRVPSTLHRKRGFRDPDAIAGGTWEAMERVLNAAGYYEAGLAKLDLARRVAVEMDPNSNKSGSFCAFRDALLALA